MTVKELIARLQQEPSNAEVVTAYYNGAVIGLDSNKIKLVEVQSTDTGMTYQTTSEKKHWRGKKEKVLILHNERD